MAQVTCTQCGGEAIEPGYIEDGGTHKLFLRWIPGKLERGIFGQAKRVMGQRMQIDAYRCTACFHLELYATEPS